MNRSETTLLLTRPRAASERFLGELKAKGDFGQVIVSPVMRIALLPAPELPEPGVELILTSQNAIAAIEGHNGLVGRKAWCVGPATASAAKAAGLDVRAQAQDATTLGNLIEGAAPDGKLVHLCGRHRRGDLVDRLRKSGLRAVAQEVYDQQEQPLTDEAESAIAAPINIVAPVFSPRSLRLLATQVGQRIARIHIAAISPAAAEHWSQRPGESLEIAPTPDSSGIIVAVGRLFDAVPSA
ncbi:uroporphyrinogen-III synthase [Aliiruegeria haliotis]|uniref:Uroporphyrinogen-III synthase n=1 Tax=Aliiruegeria haliotis TaxID=1280846 RepID=A0A2T0RHY9_9RHOB|nr:uroporphyrinogen-III synthase [Aliiruegeria haliotis]PRY20741.1 uroporphyrinogen-III synthase [Aliiruegeria haliotis]